MPYDGEYATGESLIWLHNSQALRDFKGTIRHSEESRALPESAQVNRRQWWPRHVIAVDGSHIITPVKESFPGAEAGLLMISVVAIKLDMLRDLPPGRIPRHSIFQDMENACTVEAALPGIGVVRKDVENDEPVDFFRTSVFETLSSVVAQNHETLLETLREIVAAVGYKPKIDCPAQGCEKKFQLAQGEYSCSCERKEKWFETDILRLHEYFDGVRSSGEAHGRLRSAIEILVLLNILRFFAKNRPAYFRDCAFVLDGPLAIFGAPASILRPIREEFVRLNDIARQATGNDIAVFGIEKSGGFFDHWEQIDHDDKKGPRAHYDNGAVIPLADDYIRQNIKPGKTDKPFGDDTHFGRAVLYKTKKGEHVVLNTAMLNKASQNFRSSSLDCYPRLGDILDVMDQLATHLYRDGFLPLVRAHAHAAIPLKRGADILKNLLGEK